MNGQYIHDSVRCDWRRLHFFQHEAWLHADVPRVDRDASGVVTAVEAPWERLGGVFSLLFEAFAQSICAPEKMNCVALVFIDDLSFRPGRDYVTVVHVVEAPSPTFASPR